MLIPPEKVGVSTRRLQRLDAALQRYVDQDQVAGIVVLLSRRGQVFYSGCYGLADREHARPMQPDTLIRLWSITKAITTVAALILYEQGYFALDQAIADFIPAFRETKVSAGEQGLVDKARPITIRHLLTHTAGLDSDLGRLDIPSENRMTYFLTAPAAVTLAEITARLARVPLVAQPNTLWRYGPSFEVIARLIEVISGQSFAAFLRDHLFLPLGMTATGYTVRPDQIDRFSAFYTPAEQGGLRLIEAPATSPHVMPAVRSPHWTPGSYGLVSTPLDVLRFAHLLFRRGTLDNIRLLAPRTVDLMTANHLPPALLPCRFTGAEPLYGYGHGLGVHTLLDHGLAGSPCANGEYWKDGGSGTLFWVDPAYELVGTAFYQLNPFWIRPIFATIKALTYQALDD